MSKTLTELTTLTIENCIVCGVVHAIPQSLRNQYQANGGFWTCPNGHSQGWDKKNSQSAVDELRQQLTDAKGDLQYFTNRTNELHDEKVHLERSLSAKKGQITKIKNRIAKGVCPCCHRSFEDVKQHMQSQHPEFAE